MYRLQWDSKFTIDNLDVTTKDDPFIVFPFVRLKGMRMKEILRLDRPSCNSPRGIKELYDCKLEPLDYSLKLGWWVHSWLIPTLNNVYFDRRHTVKIIEKLINEGLIDQKTTVPIAEYERVFVKSEPLISSFSDTSMILMLGMLANVLKADGDVTGEQMFNAVVSVIKSEYSLNPRSDLKTVDTIQRLLRYMGAGRRFSDAKGYVSTRLTKRIYDAVNDTGSSAGANAFNIQKSEMETFVNNDNDWQPGCWNNTTEDKDYVYRIYTIDTIKDHHRQIVEKIHQWMYKLDNEARNAPTVTNERLEPKTLKVLLRCEKTAKFEPITVNIEKARSGFKEYFKESFYITQRSVTSKFQEASPKYYEDELKHPSDYKLEIHFLPQVDGEDSDQTILWKDMDLKDPITDSLDREEG